MTDQIKYILILSTGILLVSTGKIPNITTKSSNDILYHLVCNVSSIKYVFYYPIEDGRVEDDLVFKPFQIYPHQLTATAIAHMTPMCTKLAARNNGGVNHEWFISSEKFRKPFKVRNYKFRQITKFK